MALGSLKLRDKTAVPGAERQIVTPTESSSDITHAWRKIQAGYDQRWGLSLISYGRSIGGLSAADFH